jgi:4-hydroxybenzoate polyprenyltransferase
MKFLKQYLKVARVESWLGWILCFWFGSFFSCLPPPGRTIVVFFAFLFATASIFILNQYVDREEDRLNILKSNLPLASGKIAPRAALVLSLSLIVSCLLLVSIVAVSLTALFLLYLAFWTAYSFPPFRLKSVPIVDFVTSGIGAGFLPFLIGVSTSSQPNVSISLILTSAIPLMLAHSSGHILQALGDYEADRENGVQTIVVKYGRKKSIVIMGLLSLAAGLLPFVYVAFAIVLPSIYFPLFFLPLPFCIPIAKRYVITIKNPTTENVVSLQKASRKYGIVIMALIGAYVLVGKIFGL